jgi:hypothetical protein
MYKNNIMVKFILLILLSIFLLPIMQNTANAQSITGQNGSTNDSTLAPTSNNFKNNSNTPASQGGLLQNNPGYAIYIPGTGFLKNTTNNSGNESLNTQSNSAINPNNTNATLGNGAQ